jgi:hypothetical protein
MELREIAMFDLARTVEDVLRFWETQASDERGRPISLIASLDRYHRADEAVNKFVSQLTPPKKGPTYGNATADRDTARPPHSAENARH